ELTRSTPGNGAGTSRLTGELTLHGVTRSLEVVVTVRQLDAETLEIEGTREIDMRDFGLPPPSFLMFRMQPQVQVRAKLVAERKVGLGVPKSDASRVPPSARSRAADPVGGLQLPDALRVDGEEEERLLRLPLLVEAGLPGRALEVLDGREPVSHRGPI